MSSGIGQTYSWKELGSSGCKTTNVQRQGLASPAGGTPYIANPGANNNIIIYQIDCDISEPLCNVIIGDGTAVENGTNRIAFNHKGISNSSVTFPQGFMCRPNQPVVANIIDGDDGVDTWIRITYTIQSVNS